MKRLLMLLGALGTLGCAAATARQGDTNAASAADRDAVITAVQALFDAMRTRDTSAIRDAFTPGAQLVSVRTVPGAPARMQTQPLAAFVTSIGRASEELVERMWDPRVEVAGDIASLWAPYEFRIGANFSHCGHDAVHLVRTAEGWKIAGIAYTVVTTGCSGS
jgi:ketosteroid isomerase-like protein